MDPDEFLRLRLDRDAPRAPRPDLSGSGSPAFVGRVTTTGTTSANHYVKVNPVTVSGAETEGGSGTLTVDTGVTILVLFLGPGTTTVGDDLVVKWGDYRWVAVKKTAVAVQCGTITYTIKGCNALVLNGATVTVYDGPTNASPVLVTGTTNSSGVYVAAIYAAKTYYYEVSRARFVTQSGTVAAACSGSSNTAVALTLTTPATGYVCSSATCAVPFASTWFLTDSAGTISLTWNGLHYVGSHNITRSGFVLVGGVCTANASVTGAVTYRLDAPSISGTPQLQQSWRFCGVPSAARFSDATGPGVTTADAFAASTSCATPASNTFTLPGTAVFDAGAVVTVSE